MTVPSDRLGSDMSKYPLDQPVPDLPETEHLKSRAGTAAEHGARGATGSPCASSSIVSPRRAGTCCWWPTRRKSPTRSNSGSAPAPPTASTSCRPPSSRPVRRLRPPGRADPAGALLFRRRLCRARPCATTSGWRGSPGRWGWPPVRDGNSRFSCICHSSGTSVRNRTEGPAVAPRRKRFGEIFLAFQHVEQFFKDGAHAACGSAARRISPSARRGRCRMTPAWPSP